MKELRCNKTVVIASFVLLIYMQACGQTSTKDKLIDYKPLLESKLDKRDSAYFLYTIKEWGKQRWNTWAIRNDIYKISIDDINYFVGSVFYSPDKTKVLVWVGQKMPNVNSKESIQENPDLNKICPESEDTVYNMGVIIGFRNNQNELWKLYPFNEISATCYSSEEEVFSILSNYFFVEMKDDVIAVKEDFLDPSFGGKQRKDLDEQNNIPGFDEPSKYKYKEYGYNLQDLNFWDKSLIWQKGANVKGYYDFQLKGEDTLSLPNIDYPKAIIYMFNN